MTVGELIRVLEKHDYKKNVKICISFTELDFNGEMYYDVYNKVNIGDVYADSNGNIIIGGDDDDV